MICSRGERAWAVAVTLLLLLGSTTQAADLYWSGTNTWDTSSQIWGTASGGPYDQAIWNNATPDAAIFEGTAGTVTLGTGITASGLTFDATGYTVSGNVLTLAGTPTVTTASGVTATMSSTLAGSAGLTKSGAGTLVLTTSGTYSGGTTVSGGTLQVGNGGGAITLGSGGIAVAAGATLAYSVSSSTGVTLPAPADISGAGGLSVTAGGVTLRSITLGGSQVYSQLGGGGLYNGFAIDAGTTTLTGGSISLSGDVGKTDSDGGTLVLDTTAANGAITLDISLGRGGVWYVPAAFQANAGTGLINVTGTGQVDSGWRSTPVTLAGDMNITAGVNSDSSVTLNQTNASPGLVSGNLSGSMSLTKAGAGTLVVTGSSSYTGGTTISAGTLQYGDGGSGSVTLTGGTIGGTGNLAVTEQAISLGGAVNLTGSGAVTITQTNGGTFPFCINLGDSARSITAAAITISGDVGNNDRNGGSLVLDTSAANGAIDLNVSLGRNAVTYVPNSLSANAGTGVITISGTGPGGSGWRSTPVTLTGDMNITSAVNSGAAVTLNQTNASPGVVSGVLSGGMSLTKAGAGTLAASAVNTFSGGLVVNAGTFQAAAATTGNESAIGAQGNAVTVNSGARLEFTVGRGAGFHNGSVAINGGRVSFNSGDNSLAVGNTVTLGTAAGTIDGTGQWRFRGGATLRVLAAASGSTLSTSTVDLYDGNQTFNVDAGATLTVSAGLTAEGGGVYNKSGGGTMAITAVQSGYGGSVTINAGTLDIAVGTAGGAASGLGSGGNAVAVGTGATLLFSGGSRTAGYHSGTVTVNNGTITFNTTDNSFANGRTVTLDVGPGTINGTGMWRRREANNRVAVTAAASGSVISVADLNLLDNSPVFDVANGSQANDLTISGGITGGATLTKTGVGTLAVTGANTSFTGATAINAGTLLVANANALGASGGVTIGASGTLGVDAGVAFSRPLTISSGGRVSLGAGSSVALPNAAALSAFESVSTAGSATTAEILFGSGATTPSALTSGWVAKPAGDYYSDILSLDGTGAGNTYVLSLAYDNTVTNPAGLNISYRTGTSGPFTPLGTSFVGTTAWTNESTVGQYGVDTTAGTVWVVTDHNSQFVVVPEPGVGLLAGVGGLALVAVIARRRRSNG